MPRERNPSRLSSRATKFLSPQKTPIQLPLNDDQQEKSLRLQSRQALHELQINQIKAAASPARKRRSLGPIDSPRSSKDPNKENDGSHELTVVGGASIHSTKRVPILANFEEWMKMATDNKINATNSWNFALIDYFHDMSLLKEGDGVNFQKASCTLDGCVKIYTSRVDSVATETGKLLSGLADSGNKKRKSDEESGEGVTGDGDDDEEEGEDGARKRSKRKAQRSSETTLVSSFAQLQLKKMELEFAVDPLFKKASADFDEGGAKGLLLNHLTIDGEGRIVFDSSEETVSSEENKPGEDDEADNQISTGPAAGTVEGENEAQNAEADQNIDIECLRNRFFPNLDILDEQDVCPSLKTFELGGSSGTMDIPFLKAPEDWKKDSEQPVLGSNLDEAVAGFDDDDEVNYGGFDVAGDVGFGEGGEAWAKEAAITSRPQVHNNEVETDGVESQGFGDVGPYDPNSAGYGIMLTKKNDFEEQENILKYFDQTLRKNWAGPQHWRIQKIKDNSKPAAPMTKRKEKEPFQIDFRSPLPQSVLDALTTPAANKSSISLPKSQWKSKTRNLLPDDKHFHSKQLLSLFLNPNARIGSKRSIKSISGTNENEQMDEKFWANRQATDALEAEAEQRQVSGDYDANFFQDDDASLGGGGGGGGLPDDDDDEFADAREHFSPGLEGDAQSTALDGLSNNMAGAGVGGFGDQLVTQNRRLRPEYVQYARVAKKVDVRRLKEEMWKGLDLGEVPSQPPTELNGDEEAMEVDTEKDAADEDSQKAMAEAAPSMKFTSVMNDLQTVYPKQAMADISTSYCFICLLHLANEKGLILKSNESFEEIEIRRDFTARITEIDA